MLAKECPSGIAGSSPDNGAGVSPPNPATSRPTRFESDLQMIEVRTKVTDLEMTQPQGMSGGVNVLDGGDQLRLIHHQCGALCVGTHTIGYVHSRRAGDNYNGRNRVSLRAIRVPQRAQLTLHSIGMTILMCGVLMLGLTGCVKTTQGPGGRGGAGFSNALVTGSRPQAVRSHHPASTDRRDHSTIKVDTESEAPGVVLTNDPQQSEMLSVPDVSDNAVIELGPEIESTRGDLPHGDRKFDPGAVLLAETIQKSIGLDELTTHDVEIAMRPLRNQSRANSTELSILRTRLLALLGTAAEGRTIRFVEEETPLTEYTLGGSVYLINREGKQYWELYLALKPIGANWRIWKNADPVRLERETEMVGDDRIEYAPRTGNTSGLPGAE